MRVAPCFLVPSLLVILPGEEEELLIIIYSIYMTFPAPDIRVATKSTISPSAERAQHRSLLHGAKLLRPGCVPAARPLCQPLPVPQELPDRASPDKLRAQPGCLENISLACSRGCACVCEWSAGSDTKARPTRRVPGRNRAYCNTTSPGSGLLNSHNALKKKKKLMAVSLFPLHPRAAFCSLVSP